MTTATHCEPLLAGDPEALARKLAGSGGLLREYWDDFHRRFLQNPESRAQMIFLPALVSGDGLDEARAVSRRYWQSLAADDGAHDVQFHTWCRCGAALRQAVFFDWLAWRGAWSPSEVEEAAEAFLGFAYRHPYAVSLARGRSSNNQIIAMTLFEAVAGFLFGHKLARHPTGQFLFEYGLGRLPELIGLFPGDGYGGEGSTYTSHVNTPLACWLIAWLRQISGRDWADTPFAPNGTTLRRMLEMERQLLSPGGWLAPWDHYGWQRELNGAPFAMLARLSGDPRYLALIPALTDTTSPGMLAWGRDDPLWTLVWWPEEFADYDARALPAGLFGWFLPKTGAALDDVARRSRLTQVWDSCADSLAGIGRAQCNPNHLSFEYAGEPVFQDGVPDNGHDPWRYPAEAVFAHLSREEQQRFLSYRSSLGDGYDELQTLVPGIAPGLIGAANAIVVDDEPWYWPGRLCVGQPLAYARTDTLQLVSADAAAFYQPRYDVLRAERTSAWSAEGFGIVLDSLAAGSAHQWTWQAHLRPEVTVTGDTARVALPNGQHILLAWSPVAEVRTTPLEGFPRTQEKRSCRLELRQRGVDARFAVVIAPGAQSVRVRSVGDRAVEIEMDGRPHTFDLAGWIAQYRIKPAPADIHELPDIAVDFEAQAPALQVLARWSAAPARAAESLLSPMDDCLAQLAAPTPDAPRLLEALRSADWPVQMAAAEALGRRGCREAASALREVLRREHADRALYAPNAVKRWRLKTAVIVALGRLGDRECVPLLNQILADGRDFYCVYSVIAQALGRIGGPEARAALTRALNESEHNTHARARAALEFLERGKK
jgi:hypothetical protein